jgi:hypothetical protein
MSHATSCFEVICKVTSCLKGHFLVILSEGAHVMANLNQNIHISKLKKWGVAKKHVFVGKGVKWSLARKMGVTNKNVSAERGQSQIDS